MKQCWDNAVKVFKLSILNNTNVYDDSLHALVCFNVAYILWFIFTTIAVHIHFFMADISG